MIRYLAAVSFQRRWALKTMLMCLAGLLNRFGKDFEGHFNSTFIGTLN
jgi:hypothetical protein